MLIIKNTTINKKNVLVHLLFITTSTATLNMLLKTVTLFFLKNNNDSN